MRSHKNRRLLATLLIFCILPIIPITSATDATIIQSNQNSSQQINHTLSLQERINHAQPGSTLQLATTTYTEVLTIDKPLHINGDGSTRTFLQPTSTVNGYAIQITAEGVCLSNLSITNYADGLYTTGVKIVAENTTIDHCMFHDTPIGIAIWSSRTTITGSSFQGCSDEGIVLLGTQDSACSNVSITSCYFFQNGDGIELQYAQQTHIVSCVFTRNTHAGIDAIESDNNYNTIVNCSFINNEAFGIYLAASSYNIIKECVFSPDVLMLVHATHVSVAKSQITNIHLLDNSTLLLDQCIDMTSDHINAEQSTYEIRIDTNEQSSITTDVSLVRYQQMLMYFLFRCKTLRTFIEQLAHARM